MDSSSGNAGLSRSENLTWILRSLESGNQDIYGAALLSDDGLMIAGSLPHEIEEVRIGGMGATLTGLGARTASELRLGEMEQVVVRGSEGYAVLVGASPGTVLIVLARANAKLGLLFLDMSRAVKEIRLLI